MFIEASPNCSTCGHSFQDGDSIYPLTTTGYESAPTNACCEECAAKAPWGQVHISTWTYCVRKEAS